MAADLDAALQPGETIVYRTRGRSYAGVAVGYGTILAIYILFWWIVGLTGATFWGAAVGSTACLGLYLLISAWWQRRDPDDLIITERRLMYADSNWDDKLAETTLDRIEAFTWSTKGWLRQLTVAGVDEPIRITHLRERNAAAKAIADAAGIESPPPLGLLTTVDAPQFGTLVTSAAFFLVMWFGLEPPDLSSAARTLEVDVIWLEMARSMVLLAIALLIGALLGGSVLVSILRAFLTAEEMQTVLCAGKRNRWPLRMALKWASVLYGRELPYKRF